MPIEHNSFPTHLQESIDKIAKKEGFITYNVDKTALTDGASFLGDHFLVTIKGKTKEGDKENHVFIKMRVEGAKIGNTVSLPQAYDSESYVYNKLFNIFNELQEEAGIPEDERFDTIKSYDESNTDALFLENVALKGYQSFPRTYLLTLDLAEKSVEELAKFHALAFITQKQRPEEFDKIKSTKIPFIFNKECATDGESLVKVSLKYLKGEVKERLQKFLPKFSDKRKELMLTTTPSSCLCHGDFRFTNLLVKMKNKEVSDLKIVDYQLLNYGCPLNDFLCFIFTGTDKNFRKQHLEYLKEFYYDSLSKFLEKFHMIPEEIYPKKQFEKDYKERLDFGLVSALFFMPYFLAAEGETPDIETTSVSDIDFKMLDCFPERIQGIVEDFIVWGYL